MFFEGSEFFEKKQKKFLRNFGNGLKWRVAKLWRKWRRNLIYWIETTLMHHGQKQIILRNNFFSNVGSFH